MPTLLGERYQIISTLGVGGFGQTYLVEDIHHPEQAACVIKQFKPSRQDPQFLEIARRLFDTEVSTLRRLGQHPQIPTFLDFFEEAGEFYLVQELIDGDPLSYEFAMFDRISEAQAIEILQDLLPVLEFVHSYQVIHRDIKPGNLIRRRADRRIVLIDFGAVKEIQTQLQAGLDAIAEPSSVTVGIGTQGYCPSEQLAGHPRFCSDLYSLGVTLIQALTGLHPMQIPVEPETGELVWQVRARISPGFTAILERMVRYHFSQRFQSAREILLALQQLPTDTLDLTQLPTIADQALAPAEPSPPNPQPHQTGDPNPIPPSPDWMQSETSLAANSGPRRWLRSMRPIAFIALAVSSLVVGIRQSGGFDLPELAVYDRFMQWRPALAPDERLLLVEISEQDLQRLQRPTPSDRDLARAIQVLMQHQPSVIGLSLLRDLPQEPGRADFLQQLQRPEVITLFTLGDDGIEIPPPLGIPSDRIGFSDVPLDLDGVIRRNLMFASTSTGSYSSFAVQIALKYLGDRGIAPRNSSAHPDLMQLGDRVVFPLERNSGGYRQLDAGGYQILLDYQSPTPAPVVSFVDVVNDRLDPSLVRGKIVLLGTTAASSKDFFKTPYSAGQALRQMSGLMLHAQMVSQLLRTVLDRRPLFRFLPEWAELLWLVGWAAVGSSVAWLVRRPIALSLGTVALLVGLSSIHFALFINHVWLPVIAPAIAILITSVVTVSYRSKR